MLPAWPSSLSAWRISQNFCGIVNHGKNHRRGAKRAEGFIFSLAAERPAREIILFFALSKYQKYLC
jgi:hypothetical protein